MTAKSLAGVTTDLIHAYGNTARHVINAYRVGGERIVDAVEERWEGALQASGPKWTNEMRHQALAAQRLAGGFCARSLGMTTQGADELVQQIIRLATGGVKQAAANATRFEEQTGFCGLNQLSATAAPAAEVAGRLARQLELKTAEMAEQLVRGNTDEQGAAKRVTPFKKARGARLRAA